MSRGGVCGRSLGTAGILALALADDGAAAMSAGGSPDPRSGDRVEPAPVGSATRGSGGAFGITEPVAGRGGAAGGRVGEARGRQRRRLRRADAARGIGRQVGDAGERLREIARAAEAPRRVAVAGARVRSRR